MWRLILSAIFAGFLAGIFRGSNNWRWPQDSEWEKKSAHNLRDVSLCWPFSMLSLQGHLGQVKAEEDAERQGTHAWKLGDVRFFFFFNPFRRFPCWRWRWTPWNKYVELGDTSLKLLNFFTGFFAETFRISSSWSWQWTPRNERVYAVWCLFLLTLLVAIFTGNFKSSNWKRQGTNACK